MTTIGSFVGYATYGTAVGTYDTNKIVLVIKDMINTVAVETNTAADRLRLTFNSGSAV